MKISIIIPCFNEKNFIIETLVKVNKEKKKFNLEIIVSDDCSSDGTVELLDQNKDLFDKIIKSKINKGKGHALKEGFKVASGDIILIQDADFEYDPSEYSKIIGPFLNNKADVVFGSRFLGSKPKRIIYFKNRVANFIITLLVNILTNLNFTDVETGFKAFKKNILEQIILKENSFGFEIELTMKIAKLKKRIFEIGISYNGRTIDEGKKIRFKDGLVAIYCIIKYKFIN
jgi:glycosyltransferase involved in cell wall biosynthesis